MLNLREGDALMDTRGTFTSAHELLDLIRARQVEIGLSNKGMEHLCDFAEGVVDKYLGPARLKLPGLFHIMCMMDALGLSGTLHVDPRKVEKYTPAWRREGKRKLAAIRDDNPRVSKAMLKRARPAVLSEFSSLGNTRRWGSKTASERAAHVAKMNAARLEQHRARLPGKRR